MSEYMPGYKLHIAARRASILIEPLRSPVYATTAQFQHRFARTRSDGLPLEKTGPAIYPLWKCIASGFLTAFAIAIILVIS